MNSVLITACGRYGIIWVPLNSLEERVSSTRCIASRSRILFPRGDWCCSPNSNVAAVSLPGFECVTEIVYSGVVGHNASSGEAESSMVNCHRT